MGCKTKNTICTHAISFLVVGQPIFWLLCAAETGIFVVSSNRLTGIPTKQTEQINKLRTKKIINSPCRRKLLKNTRYTRTDFTHKLSDAIRLTQAQAWTAPVCQYSICLSMYCVCLCIVCMEINVLYVCSHLSIFCSAVVVVVVQRSMTIIGK